MNAGGVDKACKSRGRISQRFDATRHQYTNENECTNRIQNSIRVIRVFIRNLCRVSTEVLRGASPANEVVTRRYIPGSQEEPVDRLGNT